MALFKSSIEPFDPPREIDRRLRLACLATLWFSVAPLFFSLPLMVNAFLWTIPGAVTVLSLFRPAHWALRGAALLASCLGVFALQAGTGDFRALGLGMLVATILMKGTELRTTRDGYSVMGFSLIGPFVAFLMEIGGLFTIVTAGISLIMALSLGAVMGEWQERLPVRPWWIHGRNVLLLGLTAAPVAAFLFWLTPRLDGPLWGIPGQPQATSGFNNRMSPGDVGEMMEDPSTAFRVDFQAQRPRERDLYWRGLSLNHFDGRAWSESPSPLVNGERLPANLYVPENAARVSYSISMEPTEQVYLFALDNLVSPPPATTLQMDDGRLMSSAPLRRFKRMENLTSVPNSSLDREGLSPLQRQRNLALPAGFNPRAVALGQQWRKEGLSEQQVIDKALALYRQNFSYSLRAPLLGQNSVDEFLFSTRTGFCEHFSSSFAVLMRAAGIPTRVVVGYQGGMLNEFGGYWRVRNADAHAWNEVWIQGRGWVRVDPTSAVQRIGARGPGQETGGIREMTANGALADWIRKNWSNWFERFDSERQRDLLRMAGLEGIPTWAVMLVLTPLVAAMIWGLSLLLLRERRAREPAELQAWRKLIKHLERQGYQPKAHEAPATLVKRIAEQSDASAETLVELKAATEAFCQWQYANQVIPGLASRLRTIRLPRRPKRP
jgi:hypothetical protein